MNNMPVNNKFSRLLADKGNPEKRRIPLTEVAEKTNISYPTLLAWANNRVARYDVSVIDALAKYFQIKDIGELLEYVDTPAETSPKKKTKA
jgi:transcriptional regulator with XRE-family HTH domain